MSLLIGMLIGWLSCLLLVRINATVQENPSEFPAWFPSLVMWVGNGYPFVLALTVLALSLLLVFK